MKPVNAVVCFIICLNVKGSTWELYRAKALLLLLSNSLGDEVSYEVHALLNTTLHYIVQLESIDMRDHQETTFELNTKLEQKTSKSKLPRDEIVRSNIRLPTTKSTATKMFRKECQEKKVITISNDVVGRLGNWTLLKAMEKLLDLIPSSSFRAKRICRPGPHIQNSSSFWSRDIKHCLILGDSVSIGYTGAVKELLQDECVVHHAPWSGDGGSLDTGYILQCLPLFLSNSKLNPVKYDVIVLNAGLHDVNCCNFTEEFVPISSYAKNLRQIKQTVLNTGAEFVFATSTPIPFNDTLNDMVKKYNNVAKKVMHENKSVNILDLYQFVKEQCKGTKLVDCDIFQGQPNVHFTENGYEEIGKIVAKSIQQILLLTNFAGKTAKQESVHLIFLRDSPKGSVYCLSDSRHHSKSMHVTGCPGNSTCSYNKISHSMIGCCMSPGAMDCGDSWHCCPRGTICDPLCTLKKCTCRKAPWESKSARITFSLIMHTITKLWDRLSRKYADFSIPKAREFE